MKHRLYQFPAVMDVALVGRYVPPVVVMDTDEDVASTEPVGNASEYEPLLEYIPTCMFDGVPTS
jgi:hypothetical protein